MRTRRIGSTNVEVSVLGFGGNAVAIPAAFWADLRAEGSLAPGAPTPETA